MQDRDHTGGKVRGVKVGDLSRGGHGNTDGAVRAGCGVGDQRQHGGLERVEAQGHQQGGTNSDRDTETSRTLDESAKAEGNQQHLDALVIGNRRDGGSHGVEVTGAHGDAVEPHGHEHNPAGGSAPPPNPGRSPPSSGCF